MTPGFPAFLAVLWYFDGGGVFWSFLAAIAVHELALYAALHFKTGVWSIVTAGLLLVRLLQMQRAEKTVAFPGKGL